jgi:hypothetical protein
MKNAYVSFLPRWAELRKQLPLGKLWPEAVLRGMAGFIPLPRGPALDFLEGGKDPPFWVMSPWPLKQGLAQEAALIRRIILKGLLRHQVQKAVLSGPLLKAGGGLKAWKQEDKKGFVRIEDGCDWDIGGAAAYLLTQPPAQVLLAGTGAGFVEMAAALAPWAAFLTLWSPQGDWTALEWLRAKGIHESGTVLQLVRRPTAQDCKRADWLLIVDPGFPVSQVMAAMLPGGKVWDLTAEGALSPGLSAAFPRLEIHRHIRARSPAGFSLPARVLGCQTRSLKQVQAAGWGFFPAGSPPPY